LETTFLAIDQFNVDLGLDPKGSKYLGRYGSGNTSFGSKTLHKQGYEQSYPRIFKKKSGFISSQLKLLTEGIETKGGKYRQMLG
jgi:hypothetical protein